jgi:hypothetical protein
MSILDQAFEGVPERHYQMDRGHPRFGIHIPEGILVHRPTRSPSIKRNLEFRTVQEAADYIRQLPPGAAYDCRPRGGASDGGLCDFLESVGIPTDTVPPGKTFPWGYWPTEEEIAG